jgi:hypothetical protein
MDKLLQELVKYNGQNSIEYVQGNNQPGYLVPQPLFCYGEKYESAITAKTTSFMDNIVSNISKSATCTKSEAAECLLRGLYQKFEESFVLVAMEKKIDLPQKKMDAASVEAMLCEARLNTKNARKLFKHLRLFFGQSYFESEVKWREYIAGQDFPPTVGKKILEDKTVIPFWYKLPDQLMKHQLKSMVTAEQLEGRQRVDFTIGGDHGGGKF